MTLFLVVPTLLLVPLSLLAVGWTLDGVGPAILSILGALWLSWFQYLRHRNWLCHRDSGFVPGTQHLALIACLGWLLLTTAALIWIWRTFPFRNLR